VLERDTAPLERVKPPFPRLDYSDAVRILQEKGQEIQWGDDLGAPDETILGDMHDRPVFIMNYPKAAKAFYMKENPDDPRTVLCDDLIAPEGYGEIIGGSQREDDHDRLLARIREQGLPEELQVVPRAAEVRHVPALGLRARPRAHRRVDHGAAAHPRDDPFPRMLNRLYP
jgi:asparaginyl-tRNA synthetase